jgi:hypothetical protein
LARMTPFCILHTQVITFLSFCLSKIRFRRHKLSSYIDERTNCNP